MAAPLLFSGCGSLKSHNQVVDAVQIAQRTAGVDAAITKLDAEVSDQKDMLYNLERAVLLRTAGRYGDSIKSLQQADVVVQEWENDYRKDTKKFLDNALGAITLDRLRSYEGQDYEKVMLTTLLALDRMAIGDWDTARIDIRRTHEREDLIADAKEKEIEALKEKAKGDGVGAPQTQELGGYPVDVFNSPEVKQLRNGYQNALSHYLAGFIYESLGENSLAAPGYRKALELRPENPVLKEALRGLDKRMSSGGSGRGLTDVLVVIEAGTMPRRVAQPVIMPIFYRKSRMPVNFALPMIASSKGVTVQTLSIGGKNYPVSSVVDFDAMARRSLRDDLPGMMLRGAMRLAAQGVLLEVASKAAQKKNQKNANSAAAVGVNLLTEITAAIFVASQQQIDDRMWRMLPEQIYLARIQLKPGEYDLSLDGRTQPTKVSVHGQYAVLPVRVDGTIFSVGQLASKGDEPSDVAQSAQMNGVDSAAASPDGAGASTDEAAPSPVVADEPPAVGKKKPNKRPARSKTGSQ
jgi:hypothetical protein